MLPSDHLIDKGVNVTGVAREAVAVRLGAGRDLVRVAHADEIRHDQPAAGSLDVQALPGERGDRDKSSALSGGWKDGFDTRSPGNM